MNPVELSWERNHHQEGGGQADELKPDRKSPTQSEEGRIPVLQSMGTQNIPELRGGSAVQIIHYA